MVKNNVEYQGHLKINVIMMHVCEKVSNNVCAYIGWLMKSLLEGNETLTQNVYHAGANSPKPPEHPTAWMDSPIIIFKPKFCSKYSPNIRDVMQT